MLKVCKRFQLSDPANLYNDLRWNVTRPHGFEVVMRVRCSQPKKNLDRPFKDGEIEKAGKGIPFLKLVMKLQAQKETDDIRIKKFLGMKNEELICAFTRIYWLSKKVELQT
ncbi:hypothetical protein Tco_1131640 [Tanacetum coccineum]